MSDDSGPAGRTVPDVARRILGSYAAAVASGDPTPGGGSVVATVAALAAGLAEMVCTLTLRRDPDPATTDKLRETRDRATELRSRFLDLAGQDEVAYAAYRAAVRLPKATPEETSRRAAAVEAALHEAAAVPLRVAEACYQLLAGLQDVARLGTRHALSDVTTGTLLTEAALRGALQNVYVNCDLMHDRARADEYADRAAFCSVGGPGVAAANLGIIEERQRTPPAPA